MGHKGNLVVGLDIGTTKIVAIVAELTPNGLDIVGIGSQPSKGMRKGVVINIDSTVSAIQKAVEEAELMAGCEIHSVFAGIAGAHIKGFNSHGVVAVQNREVKAQDVDRVIDAARTMAIPADREILHILPKEFVVDQQGEIRDPVGMSGVRLEARVHIVTAAATSAQNIVKCCNRCGLNIADIVLEQLASSEAVLTADEKDLGVALLDIGGGTTDLIVFSQGAIQHTAVIPIGGNHITNDIAVGIRTPTHEAEKIKHRYGCALASVVDPQETLEVPSVGGRNPRTVSRQVLGQIIEPRVTEMFTLVKKELDRVGLSRLLASGVVITGGTALLEGITDVAERIFEVPVRKGVPHSVGGLVDVVSSPAYATAVGLVLYGGRQAMPRGKSGKNLRESDMVGKVKSRFKQLLGDFF